MKISSILILIFSVFALSGCIPHTTGKTEVGVRTKKIALWGEKGVENRSYAPGSTTFFLPIINDWHTFDIKLQNLEMTVQANRGNRPTKDDLLFKTIDGNDISLDVIIVYRIDPEKAPFILQHVATDNHTLREKVVRTIARSKPRDIFGSLKTEEFYVADKRAAKSEQSKEILQEMLGPYGIIVEKVLTKDYRFNAEYQKAIEDKKVADQQMEQNKSAQHAALEEYKKILEEAKGEVNKMVADADGAFLKAKIEADAHYEKQKYLAEAIMAEGKAEAQGIEQMNKALAGGGGETMVKLAVAEALQGKRIILLPTSEGGMNLKTTNMNRLIETLGVKALADEQPEPEKK